MNRLLTLRLRLALPVVSLVQQVVKLLLGQFAFSQPQVQATPAQRITTQGGQYGRA